ncbi:sugar phosphate isomerase/epimerase family protein [Haloarcula laminariae]|uniref:sugar phosphate isomerase/epimerase family protein n=1 Tax=Haloarcula laminariae TaxID=2961577 RepID=UPI0021C60A4F|nr:sugar phosphate isomerase/epimerase family protein [Halomicroarcula laminariae]
MGLNLGAPDDAERAAARSYLGGVAELAAAVDASYFHVVPGWSVGGQSASDAREHAVAEIDRALAEAEYGDANPLIEPLRFRECDIAHTADQALSIVDELSADAGVLLDTFQMADDATNPVDAFDTVGDELRMVHLADTDRRPPGDGGVPWELVFDALDDIGFEGPVSVEVWGDNPDELTRASAAGLRELDVTAE